LKQKRTGPVLSVVMRVLALCGALTPAAAEVEAETPRAVIARAIVTEDAGEQAKLVTSLVGKADPAIPPLLTAWKESTIYIYEAAGGKIAVTLTDGKDAGDKQGAIRVDTTQPLQDEKGMPLRLAAADLTSADTDADLRLAIKSVMDVFAITDPDPAKRLQAIQEIGFDQNPDKLHILVTRGSMETDTHVLKAIREAGAMIRLKSDKEALVIAACRELGALGSIPAQDMLKTLAAPEAGASPAVVGAANHALAEIASHVTVVNFWGTLFRGLSGVSVLLVIAIGLAITFGLMGVINMAHGELIAVGAYTTYCVQNIFGPGLALSPFGHSISIPGFGATGTAYQCYFAVAIPLSFLMGALVGLALERAIIQWLYRRPLESLLATWGVSLLMQQIFRSVFGANNVQVDSPAWLSGNWTVFDVSFGWNRIFVITFAIAIIFGTWAILNKTPLGLLIRAVMQNRQMAACMGVRTERVNMLTFAFGSGLAGLAGAFLSQIGNVGPGMGQDHIVSAFMTVVVGGVGSIFGTVISALGIGVTEQSLQQVLGNPVMGRILVLGAIIAFLQWRPAGLFVTKSRSLEG
jgi:urea transport system permease protein